MGEISAEAFGRLVEGVYDAGLDPTRWPECLGRISDFLDHAFIALHAHDIAAGMNLGILAYRYEASYLRSYAGHYAGMNPWNQMLARMPVGQALPSECIVPPDVLRRSEFYNEWLRPQEDIGTGGGITVFRSGSRFLRVSCNIRFRDANRLQPLLVETLNLLGPHLGRSFAIMRALAGATIGDTLKAQLEMSATPAFVFDRRGRVRFANGPAERLARDGEFVKLVAGRFSFGDRDSDAALRRALNTLSDRDYLNFDGSLAVRSATTGRVAGAALAPYRSTRMPVEPLQFLVEDQPVAILFLRIPPERFDAAIAFNLTKAESSLAAGLAEGRTLQSLAEERQVSLNTVRSQLKAVFAKTNTRRQAELVALLASPPIKAGE